MTDEEIIADYDVRSPASRTLLTVIGTMVALGVLIGLVLGVSILMRDTEVTTSTVDVDGSAPIKIDAGMADVKIVRGKPGEIRITARVTSGIRTTDFELGRRGDRIKVVASCQSWLSPGCGVSTTFEVPEGIPVIVRTTSGDVKADDLTDGVLTVLSGSGDITGTRLAVDELLATTTSGDIRAEFAVQPFGVKAITGSGDISAVLPAGGRKYAVTATSKSGDVSSSLRNSKGGSGIVRATTDSGDVRLDER
ncbi:MAG: hypothetical protein JWP31_259 [Aeromicrobium sp.]|nr:hypothetical protein [Aeromicrobium sp.]